MVRALALASLVAISGCSTPALVDDAAVGGDDASSDGGAHDTGARDAFVPRDASFANDAFSTSDAGSDAFVGSDAWMGPSDAYVAPDAYIAPDAYVARDAWTAPTDAGPICVDIFVSNTCGMSVAPTSVSIPHGQQAMFCWRNRSADYPVDVWLSYGGGYTDLATGATWYEPVRHCLGPNAHDEYADISTACSSFRFLIHCL